MVKFRYIPKDFLEYRGREGAHLCYRKEHSDTLQGEWIFEPDYVSVIHEFTGYIIVIRRHPRLGHLCGYVGIPKGHYAYDLSYEEKPLEELRVHGGLTYENQIESTLNTFDDNQVYTFFGFDCGHVNDLSPFSDSSEDIGIYRNIFYVKDECVSLAMQLYELDLKHKKEKQMTEAEEVIKILSGKMKGFLNPFCAKEADVLTAEQLSACEKSLEGFEFPTYTREQHRIFEDMQNMTPSDFAAKYHEVCFRNWTFDHVFNVTKMPDLGVAHKCIVCGKEGGGMLKRYIIIPPNQSVWLDYHEGCSEEARKIALKVV